MMSTAKNRDILCASSSSISSSSLCLCVSSSLRCLPPPSSILSCDEHGDVRRPPPPYERWDFGSDLITSEDWTRRSGAHTFSVHAPPAVCLPAAETNLLFTPDRSIDRSPAICLSSSGPALLHASSIPFLLPPSSIPLEHTTHITHDTRMRDTWMLKIRPRELKLDRTARISLHCSIKMITHTKLNMHCVLH